MPGILSFGIIACPPFAKTLLIASSRLSPSTVLTVALNSLAAPPNPPSIPGVPGAPVGNQPIFHLTFVLGEFPSENSFVEFPAGFQVSRRHFKMNDTRHSFHSFRILI